MVGMLPAAPTAPGLAAAAPPPPTLPSLPLEVLELICAPLDLKQRLRLTSCCRALWTRGDTLASSKLWGSIEVLRRIGGDSPARMAALAAWLGRRRGAVQCMRQYGPANIAAALHSVEGGALRELELVLNTSVGADDEAALRALSALALTRLRLWKCGLRRVPPALGQPAANHLSDLDLEGNMRLDDGSCEAGPHGTRCAA